MVSSQSSRGPGRRSNSRLPVVADLAPRRGLRTSEGKSRGATDRVRKRVWRGIMHLPDDVALRTSDHHGTQLQALYRLWVIGSTRRARTTKSRCSRRCSTRPIAFSRPLTATTGRRWPNLRAALDLVAIGTLGNFAPTAQTHDNHRAMA